MLAAELCLVPREMIPPTVPALRAWLADVEDRGELQVTDGRPQGAGSLLRSAPRSRVAPVLRGRLPTRVRHAASRHPRDVRRCRSARVKRAAMRATFPVIRAVRPLLPPKLRYIAPYHDCRLRQRGIEPRRQIAKARRRVGIRLWPSRPLIGRPADPRGRLPPVALDQVDGVLLDIDGVLVDVVGPDPRVPIEAMAWLRRAGGPVPPDHEHDHAHAGRPRRHASRRRVRRRGRGDRHRGRRDGRLPRAIEHPGAQGLPPVRRRRRRADLGGRRARRRPDERGRRRRDRRRLRRLHATRP